MPTTAHLPPTQAQPAAAPSRSRAGLAALAAWLVVNLLMLAPDFRGAVVAGSRPAGGALALLLAVPSSLVLTAAAWAAFRLTRRHTVGRLGFVRSVAVHAAAALGFGALDLVVRKAERLLLADFGAGFAPVRDVGELVAVAMVYAMLTVVAHAVEYARRYRARQLAELRLQAALARAGLERAAAELRVLKLQLTPHFLFNSLHAASALVHHAPAAAERMLARLADLLRHATTRAGTQEVPLDEELHTLAAFLEVEEIRLGGRLRVAWGVEPAARGAWVPHMLLQPLVENAVKHGLTGGERGGCVGVSARREGAWLELAVRDDGVGLQAAAARGAAGAGIGTANTRARLAQLYGDDHALEIAPAEGGGTRVSLRLPWHEAPWPSPALDASATDAADRDPTARGGVRRWRGPVLAGALFLFLWYRAFVGMRGQPVLPERVVGSAEAVTCGMLNAATLTLLVYAALAMARRIPVAAGTAARALRRQAGAALLLGAGVALARNACAVPWGTPVRMLVGADALRSLALQALLWAAVFAAVSLVAHVLEFARRARAKEAAELSLQASLARARLERTSAELRGLQMQVNPGFLFTALGAAAARMRHAPDEAERMVVRLADLLRQAMGADGAREVALEDEVRALQPFLDVERIRLGERLRVEWTMEDDALDAQVPRAVLQPLVMQAVARAATGDGEGMRVHIEARRRGDRLELEVRADGPAAGDDGAGDAAAETRARLARLYGEGCSVEVAPAPEGGTRAVLHLPWHEEPWPAAAVHDPREERAAR